MSDQLTPATITNMSQEEWGRTFMPALMDATTPATPTPDDTPAEPEPQDAGALRGPDGKFMARPVDDAAPTTDEPPADDANTVPTEPAAPTITLPFAAVGADDAPVPVEQLAAMKLTLKANGQEQTLPLADVVRQAQSAAGATRQANELRATLGTKDTELAAVREQQTLLEQALTRVLTDDDALAALRQQYAAYTSPEAELARIRQEQAAREAAEREQQTQSAQMAQAATFTNALSTTMAQLLADYPEVTPQELLGQFNFDTAGLAVNGVIPPDAYPQVEAYVAQSLTAFAQQRHTERVALRTKADAAKAAAEAAARTAKTTMAAAVRPVGSVAGAPSAKPALSTLRDASAYALQAFGGGPS